MENEGATIVVGDSHPLYRLGLRSMMTIGLNFNDVVDVGNFSELLSVLSEKSNILLILADLDLPGMSGAGGVRHLRSHFPEVRVIALSAANDRGSILEVLSAGAHGFIMKTMSDEEMAAAVRTVIEGRVYVPSLLSETGVQRPASSNGRDDEKLQNLTRRQRQVLEQMSCGKSNKEIARYLGIAESTVKVHLNAAFNVLGVHNRVSAMVAIHELDLRLQTREPSLPGLLPQIHAHAV